MQWMMKEEVGKHQQVKKQLQGRSQRSGWSGFNRTLFGQSEIFSAAK